MQDVAGGGVTGWVPLYLRLCGSCEPSKCLHHWPVQQALTLHLVMEMHT